MTGAREEQKNDRRILESICDLLAADKPEGLNWPGVARLIRRHLEQLAAQQAAITAKVADLEALVEDMNQFESLYSHAETQLAAQQAQVERLTNAFCELGADAFQVLDELDALKTKRAAQQVAITAIRQEIAKELPQWEKSDTHYRQLTKWLAALDALGEV